MKICLIAEGSYPYYTGGVSSWMHSLMTNMPEHEFIIYTIAAETKQQGQFRYTLPDNVIEVKEIFLDTYMAEDGSWGERYKLTEEQRQAISVVFGAEGKPDWGCFFDFVRSKQIDNAAEFLYSRDFFSILEQLCQTKYTHVPFTEMFWTVRSMILPLLVILRSDIPEADLYHSVSAGYAGVVGALARHLYGKPLLLTEHGIYSREREEEIIKAEWVKGYFKDLWIQYFYKLSAAIYDAADQVVTLFNRNREIEIELGCDADKIAIIRNGVNIERFADLPARLDDGVVRIGAIVRVVPIKDIKTMLQSFALVKQEIPHSQLVIMGPTDENREYYDECLQMINLLELKDVTFTGNVQLKEYLGQMDVLMLTSISEGQPLAVLEGMACGKPFVTTNVGSCKELLEGNEDGIGPAGYVAPVMHYEEIAQQAVKLCRDAKLREDMGRNGLERVQRYYRHEDFIANYRSLYEKLKEGQTWQASDLS